MQTADDLLHGGIAVQNQVALAGGVGDLPDKKII